jgi:hypothetical protein
MEKYKSALANSLCAGGHEEQARKFIYFFFFSVGGQAGANTPV